MAEPLRRLFTTSEYHTMREAGILSEGGRFELIEGEIWEMAPIGSPHAGGVARVDRLLQRALGDDVIVSVQNPLHLDDFSEPEPDLQVLRFRPDFYSEAHPTADDVLFLVEVADSSLEYDRKVKIVLYARHGLSEAWLVNLREDILETYRSPSPRGYLEVRQFRRGKIVSPQAFPEIQVKVDDLLGQASLLQEKSSRLA
jgi:Uma2 family endonuclease